MRREDWLLRLERVLLAAEGRAFSWGEFDCCTLGADCVNAVLGFDPAPEIRRRYATRGQAFRLLRREFGGFVPEMLDAMAARHDWREVLPLQAQRGDLALVMSDEGHKSVAVVDVSGRCLAYPATRGGLVRVPLSSGLRAWGVQ